MKAVALLAALVGCNSAPAATTDFFGTAPAPPRGLAKLHPGMSIAEAKQLGPGLHDPPHKGVRDELVVDSGVGDVTLTVRMDAGTVASIVAIVQGHGVRDLLTKAWGEPEIARDSLGQQEVTWASERTGWKPLSPTFTGFSGALPLAETVRATAAWRRSQTHVAAARYSATWPSKLAGSGPARSSVTRRNDPSSTRV